MFFGYQARLSLSLSLFSHSTRLEGGREAVTDGAESDSSWSHSVLRSQESDSPENVFLNPRILPNEKI